MFSPERSNELILIACVDDGMGMMFNNRRQSRDKLLIENLLQMCGETNLYYTQYSAKLFEEVAVGTITDNLLETVQDGEYTFVEDVDVSTLSDRIEELIVYRWNRVYPADKQLEISLENFELLETIEFAGNSHEKITREVYRIKES